MSDEVILGFIPRAQAIAQKASNRVIEQKDLFQEAMLECLELIPKYDESFKTPIYPFLYQFVYWKITDKAINEKEKYERTSHFPSWYWDCTPTAPVYYVPDEVRKILWNSIAQLSDLQRRIILWFYFDGYNLGEIAHKLGKRGIRSLQWRSNDIWRMKKEALCTMRKVFAQAGYGSDTKYMLGF